MEGGPSDEPELRIWVKEPQDDNPFPVDIKPSWVVADLAICLAKHPEFNFHGIQSKLISIHRRDEPLNRDILLTTIQGNSATNPLIAFVNPDMCMLCCGCCMRDYFTILLDGKQLENFQVACPSLSTS